MDDPYQSRHRETDRRAFGNGEAPDGASTPRDTGQLVMMIGSDLERFRGCIQSIGTQFDSRDNHQELKRLRTVIKKNLIESQKRVKAESKSNPSGPGRVQVERMRRQLDGHTTAFNDLLQQEKSTSRQAHSQQGSMNTSPEPSHQAQTQLDTRALQTREEEATELLELERDITDLHDIQTGLAGLVTEQGEVIDAIEKHTDHAQSRVERGTGQLHKAVILKRRSRKLICIIVSIIAVIIFCLLLALAIGLGVGLSDK